jgi:glutathione synthase/RimK-type ligase-like ATP-grasp enzyme
VVLVFQLFLFFLKKSRAWYSNDIEAEYANDPLLKELPGGAGAFMMGFDFHLTKQGPKLIEVNTNAGGLATTLSFPGGSVQKLLTIQFVGAIREEYKKFRGDSAVLKSVAICDDNAREQKMYLETRKFSEILIEAGIDARVVSPEEMELNETTGAMQFVSDQVPIDFIYNRICDFLLKEPSHEHIRKAGADFKVVISPHPAVYVRSADKRRMIHMKHEVVPQTFMLSDKPIEFWQENKKKYVFKPCQGFGSRGVYMGKSISRNKIATLPKDTIVQEDCSPPKSEDGSKFDLRIYTADTKLLGLATRHFELAGIF